MDQLHYVRYHFVPNNEKTTQISKSQFGWNNVVKEEQHHSSTQSQSVQLNHLMYEQKHWQLELKLTISISKLELDKLNKQHQKWKSKT